MNVRRSHSPAFKAKVAFEAAKQEKTIAQLSSRFGVHGNMVSKWKKQMLRELPGIFSTKRKKKNQDSLSLAEELYKKIGRLEMELDWLKKKSEQLS